jgi:methionyl-tRNA formyltransferase
VDQLHEGEMKPHVHFLFDPSNDWLPSHMGSISDDLDLHARYAISAGFDLDAALGKDVLFILGYTKLIPAATLARNGINLVIHESDLPKGRGFSPVQWQVLAGASSIPVRLIEATEEADAGNIVGRTTIELQGHELWSEIRALQAAAAIRLVREFLTAYPDFTRTPQQGIASTYPRRRLGDDALDPDKTIREQFNHLRIADNDRFPLHFTIGGVRYTLKVTKA